MARILLVDRDRARRAQHRSRLTDRQHEVLAVERFDETTLASRVDVALFHVEDLLETNAAFTAIGVVVAYSTETEDDAFGGAAFDRGALHFVPSGEFGTIERVVDASLRTLGRTRQLRERQQIALLENRSLRGAMRAGGGQRRGASGRKDAPRKAEGVLLLDQELRVAHLGAGAAALFGRDVLGRHLATVFPGSDFCTQVSTTEQDPRECLRVDLPGRGDGGPGRSLAVTAHPLQDRAGWLLFFADVRFRPVLAPVVTAPEADAVAPDEDALLDAAAEVYRLDPTRYLDSRCGAVRRALPALAVSAEPLLVSGAPGTGRGYVARAAHYLGAQRRAMLEIRCAGRRPGATEAELFGPRDDGPGLAHHARGGTLLVHDVDELPRHGQVLLLAAISEPGGPRLIATTTRDAATFGDGERFEGSLGSRLVANAITLSSLRDRRDRLAVLADATARRFGAAGIRDEAFAALARHDWPGNLAELTTVLGIASRGAVGRMIELADLPRRFVVASPVAGDVDRAAEPSGPAPEWVVDENDPVSFDVYERKAILRALARCGGDRQSAARLLGIGKSTIYRKIGELGIADTPSINGGPLPRPLRSGRAGDPGG